MATRSYATKADARALQRSLGQAIREEQPFDTGTREPASWTTAVKAATTSLDPNEAHEASFLEVARKHVARRWQELKPRSREGWLDTHAPAMYVLNKDLPVERNVLAWTRAVIVPGRHRGPRNGARVSRYLQARAPEDRLPGAT